MTTALVGREVKRTFSSAVRELACIALFQPDQAEGQDLAQRLAAFAW